MSQQVDPDQFTTPFAITPSTHRDPYNAILPENPTNSQKGKIIIITGGSAGIGAAAAKVWARAGAQGIVITGRRLKNLEVVAAELKSINKDITVLSIQADISVEEDAVKLYTEVQKTFGRSADVLLNNAGYLADDADIGSMSVNDWWKGLEINLKGLYSMIHHYIASQSDPKVPTGTIISVSSGRAGLTTQGGSAYNISKLAEQRLVEHLHMEFPSLRVFTTMPGIALTEMASTSEFWVPFAKDHVELTGMLALYLSQDRADYLRGGMVSVNWDVEEMEKFAKQIKEKKLLQTSWLPIVPLEGGKGLVA